MSGSPIEMTQDDETVPPAVPVAARRRGWVIAGGAFAVAAVWIVATGGPFALTDAPTASGPALAVATPPVNEPPTVNPADPRRRRPHADSSTPTPPSTRRRR